ncbi:PAS domain S-box protein [Massilia consociata]|uniref:histidine kinase n=1 Tax=Massilia consociata TaxID=760117 RepID=A0ABV6FB56_9BURK
MDACATHDCSSNKQPGDQAGNGIDDVLITHQLALRPSRAPDYRAESEALAALARELARNPRGMLQKLAELVVELCHADSAGVSVLETDGADGGKGIFRWQAAAGAFAPYLGGTIARGLSPCGIVVERNELLLFSQLGRHYPGLRDFEPQMHENMLAPWSLDGEPTGTVWAISHTPGRHFDAEDARLLKSLSGFAAAAWRMVSAVDGVERARRQADQGMPPATASGPEPRQHDLNVFLRGALDVETVGVVFYGLDEGITDCNPAFEQMTGYALAELRSMPDWKALVAPRCHEAEGRARAELAAGGHARPYMKQLVRKDGQGIWGLCAPNRLSGQGAHARCIEFVFDIDEFKRQEQGLRQREERFRILVDGVAQAMWEADPEGRVVADSPSWHAFAGQTPEEWMGQGWVDAIHPDDRAGVMQLWREAVAGKRAVSAEFRLRSREGGWCWTNMRAAPQVGADGAIQRWIGMNIDIDERARAREALRESETRFRTLAEASPALIYEFTPGIGMTYANQRCLDLFGVRPDELREANWRDLIHADDVPGYMDTVAHAVMHHAPFQHRVRMRTHDGEWRWFENHAAPRFHAGGAYLGHVGISLDITRTVRAEDELREADRRKDEFLATLAHELRNPLAPISNAVHLLRRPDGRRTADRVVEMVGRQVRHIVRLVDDLLEVSRITRGKLDLDMAPVALADIVNTAVETSMPLIESGRHQLTVSLPEESLGLAADKVRLTQVLANLLNNAAKYTDRGGHIWLRAWREDREGCGEVAVSVRDDGIGIPPASLARVFDMFAQVHRESWRGQGGLGIGLTMVRSLVEMHGGRVEARSAGEGQGSEFIVRLPLAAPVPDDSAGAAHDDARPGQLPLHGRRVLVVDDNRDAADSLALLLRAAGAEVRVAYEGESALREAGEFRPGTVLLDLGMPMMDGFEVARRLRETAQAHGQACPRIVALTGWGQEADRRRTRESGFDKHLTKPVDLQALETWLISQPAASR